MPKIFFSMAGEGRGHATRVRAIVEQLRHEAQVVLYATGDAHDLLNAAYCDDPDVAVREIPGLRFHYRGEKLSYFGSVFRQGLPYLAGLPRLICRLARDIRTEKPDLIITDFEPAMPRAARLCRVPFISFDHQHFLVVNDLSELPPLLRFKCWLMSLVVRCYYSGQQRTIVSSFYKPQLKPGYASVDQIGVLLRPEIQDARPVAGDHLLVYLRRHGPDDVLEALRNCGRHVHIFGLGQRQSEANGRVQYFPVDEARFLHDLKTCFALISNAGNQLVGEALYLQKPVLGLSETGNFEQQVNGHFLNQSGGGMSFRVEDFQPEVLTSFLERVEEFRANLPIEGVCGNETAFAAIRSMLPQARQSSIGGNLDPETPSDDTSDVHKVALGHDRLTR